MKILVCLDDAAEAKVQSAARRQLKEAGFESASTPSELASMGMLSGEISAAGFQKLKAACSAGRLPGVTSVEADGKQSIQGDT